MLKTMPQGLSYKWSDEQIFFQFLYEITSLRSKIPSIFAFSLYLHASNKHFWTKSRQAWFFGRVHQAILNNQSIRQTKPEVNYLVDFIIFQNEKSTFFGNLKIISIECLYWSSLWIINTDAWTCNGPGMWSTNGYVW